MIRHLVLSIQPRASVTIDFGDMPATFSTATHPTRDSLQQAYPIHASIFPDTGFTRVETKATLVDVMRFGTGRCVHKAVLRLDCKLS